MLDQLLTVAGVCWLLYGLGLLVQGIKDKDVLVLRSSVRHVISGGLIIIAAV